MRGHFTDKTGGVLEELQRFLEIDDVNAVAFPEDVLLHLGIPTLGLVPEVYACFEQFFHRDSWQLNFPLCTIVLLCAFVECARAAGRDS